MRPSVADRRRARLSSCDHRIEALGEALHEARRRPRPRRRRSRSASATCRRVGFSQRMARPARGRRARPARVLRVRLEQMATASQRSSSGVEIGHEDACRSACGRVLRRAPRRRPRCRRGRRSASCGEGLGPEIRVVVREAQDADARSRMASMASAPADRHAGSRRLRRRRRSPRRPAGRAGASSARPLGGACAGQAVEPGRWC